MPVFTLSYCTWPVSAKWTTTVIIIVVIIIGHWLGAPGWAMSAGLGGCLLNLAPGTARAVQLRLGTARLLPRLGER